MTRSDLHDIKNLCIPVIRKAADFIASHLYKVHASDVSEKGRNSLVSFVDRTSEEILAEGLSEILPEAGFITEEETIAQSEKHLTWIIDPLDGTTNFLHQIPCFSISVALKAGNDIVLGMVMDITRDEFFTAIADTGAMLNDDPIFVTKRPDFHDILVGTGFPYRTEHFTDAHLNVLKSILQTTRGIRRLGSAAIDLCYVACGRFGAFYENSLNSYDIAAGGLIVQEAGGYISDFWGNDQWLEKGEILGCAPQFRDIMLDLTEQFYR